MGKRVLLAAAVLLTGACGDFSEDELGLIASAVMFGVEQTRADAEGLDMNEFGSAPLVMKEADGSFTLSGTVTNICGGTADVSGSGTSSSDGLDYTMKLELHSWVLCDQPVQVSGSVDATVQADALTVTTFRDRPSKAHAKGKVSATGDGISKDNRDRDVSFDLTMSTTAGEPDPKVSGSIDGTDV